MPRYKLLYSMHVVCYTAPLIQKGGWGEEKRRFSVTFGNILAIDFSYHICSLATLPFELLAELSATL